MATAVEKWCGPFELLANELPLPRLYLRILVHMKKAGGVIRRLELLHPYPKSLDAQTWAAVIHPWFIDSEFGYYLPSFINEITMYAQQNIFCGISPGEQWSPPESFRAVILPRSSSDAS